MNSEAMTDGSRTKYGKSGWATNWRKNDLEVGRRK